MIIKSLIEIAFYSSLLVVRKISSTIEDTIPFGQKKKEKVVPQKALKAISKKEKAEDNPVSKKEKGSKQEVSKKNTPKEEAKILNYSLKTKKELYDVAQELDIEGRSTMNKAELLKALKSHSKK